MRDFCLVIRSFEPSDLATINGWYRQYGMPELTLNSLPKTGFIVEGIAAGFLFITDANLALMDAYIANPEASKEERKQALDKVTDALLEQARLSGINRVLALTKREVIEERCQNYNFKSLGSYQLFVKELF
jgi:hypothetical protein